MSRAVGSALVWFLAATAGAAEPERVRLSFSPVPGKGQGYELRFESMQAGSVELDFDRRRLRITITGRGRKVRHVCRYSQAASDAVEQRRIVLSGNGDVWAERVDLAEYCYPEALDALRGGATVEVTLGSVSAATATLPSTEREMEIDATAFSNISRASVTPKPEPDVVQIRLKAAKAKAPESLRLQVSLRVKTGTHWIYPRLDLWRFRVEGPSGSHECRPERRAITPIVDFYRRISPRRPWRETLMGNYFCPGVFEEPGVYEVTPLVDLLYSSEARPALTGTFEGSPSRVTLEGVSVGKGR